MSLTCKLPLRCSVAAWWMEVRETQRDASTGHYIKMLDLYFLIFQISEGYRYVDICFGYLLWATFCIKNYKQPFQAAVEGFDPTPGSGL